MGNITTLNMTTLDGGVIIKKETAPAPPSGGGGESGGSDWHYFDISNAAALSDKSALYEFGALVVKLSMEGNTLVGAASMGTVSSLDNCVAFGLDMSQKSNMGGEMLTYKEMYAMAGLDSFFSQIGIVEITKEEFYTLD